MKYKKEENCKYPSKLACHAIFKFFIKNGKYTAF